MPIEIDEYALHVHRVKARKDYVRPKLRNCILCVFRHTWKELDK